MDLRVAVDFAGRGLQDLGPAAFGHAQHVDRAQHRGLHGLDGVVLVMAGRGRTGQIVDLVNLQPDGQCDVVADQFEIRPRQQVADVGLLAGEEVVQADDVVTVGDQALAEMRAEKAGPAGDQDSLDRPHEIDPTGVGSHFAILSANSIAWTRATALEGVILRPSPYPPPSFRRESGLQLLSHYCKRI